MADIVVVVEFVGDEDNVDGKNVVVDVAVVVVVVDDDEDDDKNNN